MASGKTAILGNLQSAPRLLAFGGALVFVAAVTTFGLIRVNQQRGDLAADSRPDAEKPTSSEADETAQASSELGKAESESSNFGIGVPQPSGQSAVAPDVWKSSALNGSHTSPYLPPYNPAMQWAGAETRLTSGRVVEDARLDRIERQLSQVLRTVDRSKVAPASASMRKTDPSAPAANPATVSTSVAAAVAESTRAAASESQIRRELSDLRVSSEVELRQLKQHLAGLSEQQKKLLKSLRKRPGKNEPSGDEVGTARSLPSATVVAAPEAAAGPPAIQPEAVARTTTDAEQPVPTRPASESTATRSPASRSPETRSPETPAGITIVSELPLRVSVQTRSTMLSELLAEFANATGGGLLISTDLDQKIQAISLSEIAPHVLFDLLSQNQNFEIRYEANRVELRSRQRIPPAVAPEADSEAEVEALGESKPSVRVSENLASENLDLSAIPMPRDFASPPETTSPAEAALRTEPPQPAPYSAIEEPGLEKPDSEDASTQIATSPADSAPQPAAVLDPELLGLSEPMPAPPSTYPLADLQPEAATEPKAVLTTTLPMPAELPRELLGPVVSTASRNSALATSSPPAIALHEPRPQKRQMYRLSATVIHLVVTDQQNVQPNGMEPVRLHETRNRDHQSAAQQVSEQAARLGRATPVSDASVSLAEGESARLKIGWLCLHCNEESGIAAGDTLRVTVDRTESGEPRLIVQGLATASSDELSTLGTREAALIAGQSLLVTEAGTAGSVSFRDDSSRLARLPVIGRAFRKSKEIQQTAQRLIVLTATPVGLKEIEPEALAVRQTALISKPDSHAMPAPETQLVLPQGVTTPAVSRSAADRLADLFASKKSSDSPSRTVEAGSIHTAEKIFPRRKSYRPRRPAVKCEHCETVARSLPKLETIVSEQTITASRQSETSTDARSIPEIPDTTPVVFESAPARAGSAPMIDLPLPASF